MLDYLSDSERMPRLLDSSNSVVNPLPDFISELGDKIAIIRGLNAALNTLIVRNRRLEGAGRHRP
jgi:hypothetical protein